MFPILIFLFLLHFPLDPEGISWEIQKQQQEKEFGNSRREFGNSRDQNPKRNLGIPVGIRNPRGIWEFQGSEPREEFGNSREDQREGRRNLGIPGKIRAPRGGIWEFQRSEPKEEGGVWEFQVGSEHREGGLTFPQNFGNSRHCHAQLWVQDILVAFPAGSGEFQTFPCSGSSQDGIQDFPGPFPTEFWEFQAFPGPGSSQDGIQDIPGIPSHRILGILNISMPSCGSRMSLESFPQNFGNSHPLHAHQTPSALGSCLKLCPKPKPCLKPCLKPCPKS